MTNFEYYKEEILKIINDGSAFGVCKNCNQPIACEDYQCETCIAEGLGFCDKVIYPWLYAEHEELSKLNKKERQFCELVESGWIARDEGENQLYYFDEEPVKDAKHKIWESVPFSRTIALHQFNNCNFDFITCDDKEPWSIEELLKLEVEE